MLTSPSESKYLRPNSAGQWFLVALSILLCGCETNTGAAKSQMNVLVHILKDYKTHCDQYPTTEQGLAAIAAKPEKGPACQRYPKNPFIADGKLPKDPWGNPYEFVSDGKAFVIITYGKDGKEGGEGHDADIVRVQK